MFSLGPTRPAEADSAARELRVTPCEEEWREGGRREGGNAPELEVLLRVRLFAVHVPSPAEDSQVVELRELRGPFLHLAADPLFSDETHGFLVDGRLSLLRHRTPRIFLPPRFLSGGW